MSISISIIGFTSGLFGFGCGDTSGMTGFSFTGFSFVGISLVGSSLLFSSFFSCTPVVGTFTFIPGRILSGFLICVLIFFSVSKSTLYFWEIFHKVSPFFTIWIFMYSTILSEKITLHHMRGWAICYEWADIGIKILCSGKDRK